MDLGAVKKNILFIDQNVKEFSLFLNTVNDLTLPIVYNYSTTRKEILSLLDGYHFDRIAFVFHGIYPAYYYDKPFLEGQPYFTLDASRNVVMTENVTFIQTILGICNVSHVDFLGCNLLLSEEWRKYFDLLSGFQGLDLNGIIVGASNDNTGNLKYGGDWVLESTQEDVRDVYFSSGLDNYSGLLATTAITSSVTLTQSSNELTDGSTPYSWTSSGPIPIIGNNITVRFGGNFNITTANQTFLISGNNVTVDGGNNTVSVGSVAYPGLFASSKGNITIQNIIMNISSGATQTAAWLTQSNFANGMSNILISNCGIVGAGTTTYGGIVYNTNPAFITIQNCYNTIKIDNPGGGIVGLGTPLYGNVINCWNSGNISASNCGGIFAVNGGCTFTSGCYNTGNIIAGGGIFGAYAFKAFSGNATLTNCYNTGRVFSGGGLISTNFCYNEGGSGVRNITNCYNVGSVVSGAYGLIAGFNTTIPRASVTINISNCYNYSNQPSMPNGPYTTVTVNLNNIYNSGTWSDSAANGNLLNTPSSVFTAGNVWTSVASNTPYLLSAFVGNAYSPSLVTTGTSSFTSATPLSGYSYRLLNTLAYSTFNITTGVITFSNIPTTSASYKGNILAYKLINGQYANYFFTTYTLTYQKIPILYYYSLNGANMGGSILN